MTGTVSGTWESGRRGTGEQPRGAKELREEKARVYGACCTDGYMARGESPCREGAGTWRAWNAT